MRNHGCACRQSQVPLVSLAQPPTVVLGLDGVRRARVSQWATLVGAHCARIRTDGARTAWSSRARSHIASRGSARSRNHRLEGRGPRCKRVGASVGASRECKRHPHGIRRGGTCGDRARLEQRHSQRYSAVRSRVGAHRLDECRVSHRLLGGESLSAEHRREVDWVTVCVEHRGCFGRISLTHKGHAFVGDFLVALGPRTHRQV